MRNSLKRALSLVLAVLMLGSVAVMSASANDGSREWHTLETAMEYFEAEYGEEIPTKTFYFYMPEEWKSEHNDYYDGTEESYAAGVYWFGSQLCLPADYPFHRKDWPGYAVTKTDAPNVYVAEVPYDVHTIIFNNLVDGGEDSTLPIYTLAYQIANTPTMYDGADNYGFYPNGLETTENMIFVVDPTATSENEYNHKLVYNGAWLYYYGNGEYGTVPTKEEAGEFVYTGGEFPASNLVVKPEKNPGMGVGQTKELTVTKTPVTYVSDTEAVAVVETTEDGKYILKAVGEGDANITFTYFNETTEEEETFVVTANVVTPSLNCDSMELTVGGSDFFIPTGIGDSAVWTSSNEKVATVENMTVYAVGAGKATITVTQGDVVLKCDVTVKGAASLDSKKKVSVAAGGTSKIKVSGAKKITYKSNKESVATVDNNGTVTGLSKGTAKITVKADGEKLATVTVTVTSDPKLSTNKVTVKKNGKTTVKVTGAVSKPKVASCKVAKITAAKKKLTIKGGKTAGKQKINVTVNGVKLKLTITVK